MHKKIADAFRRAKDVVPFHLQTVWEGQATNKPEANHRVAKQFGIDVPIGYDAHVDGAKLSIFMTQYRTGGTPWTVVIDKRGRVAFNAATPRSADALVAMITKLRGGS
ncbi:MAG: hypothetical protein AAGD14_08810 [Planctomycetota bacterium]